MSDSLAQELSVKLSVATAIELYVVLLREEDRLAPQLEMLSTAIERSLYERLSVAEMEAIVSRAVPRKR